MNNCTLYDISMNIVPVNILMFLIKYFLQYTRYEISVLY